MADIGYYFLGTDTFLCTGSSVQVFFFVCVFVFLLVFCLFCLSFLFVCFWGGVVVVWFFCLFVCFLFVCFLLCFFFFFFDMFGHHGWRYEHVQQWLTDG